MLVKDDQYYHEYYERLPDKTVVSNSIKKHIEVNVPLLDRQINRLNKHFEKQMEAVEEEQQKIQDEVDCEKHQAENRRIEDLLRQKKKIDDLLEAERKAQSEAEFKRRQQEIEREEKIAQERREKDVERVKATKAQLGFGATFEDIAYFLVLKGQHTWSI